MWWQLVLVLLGVGCLLVLAALPRVLAIRAAAPTANRVDTAPGWIVRCTSCRHWRPAAEIGVVRMRARGGKAFLGGCSACGRWRWLRLERPDRAPDASDRVIDERTNPGMGPTPRS